MNGADDAAFSRRAKKPADGRMRFNPVPFLEEYMLVIVNPCPKRGPCRDRTALKFKRAELALYCDIIPKGHAAGTALPAFERHQYHVALASLMDNGVSLPEIRIAGTSLVQPSGEPSRVRPKKS
jgi:hypothetical protein